MQMHLGQSSKKSAGRLDWRGSRSSDAINFRMLIILDS